jgi:hypothetical protein
MVKLSENISFTLIRGDKVDAVVAFQPNSDTPLHQATSDDPNWQLILDKLNANDESVFDLFDVAGAVAKKLMVLSERITYDHGIIRFDGEVQSGPLADHLVRVIKTGTDDYKPVVKFWENVAQNPSERSREQMFTWLAKHEFSIDDDGYIIGYKSVHSYTAVTANGEEKKYRSTKAGHSFVNGVESKEGYVYQNVGDVISIPRSEVDDNAGAACSTGLHVGDWTYVTSFSGDTKMKVRVHPRDVVSIPREDARKMRCCRYENVAIVTAPDSQPILFSVAKSEAAAKPVGYAPFG